MISTPAVISRRALILGRVGSREVDAQVEVLQQQGHRVLPLKPYPDRPLPLYVVEAAIAAARDAHCAPSRGLPALRHAIAGQLGAEIRVPIVPDQQVLVTNGGMHALFLTFAALLGPGDEVIVPAPCYFLQGIADLLGFQLVYVSMSESEGYRWDHNRLAAAITPRTRAVFVNTPVNPTGYVLTEDDLRTIALLASEHGLWIIADESYDRMLYDGRRHFSILARPEAERQTVLIRSCTKSYAMPAWRVGYVVATAPVVDAMTKILEWQCLYVNTVCQAAAAAAINGPQDWLNGVAEEFQANRDRLLQYVAATQRIHCVVPQGGPFLFLNVAELGVDGDRVAQHLLHESGLAVTPGSTLQSRDHVRLAFGGAPEVIAEVGRRLQTAASCILRTLRG